LSRTGIVPIAHSQDTAGPMARTVADAAVLLTVLAGTDPADSATAAARPADFTKHLRADGLRGARIGIARQFFGYNRDVDALMESAIDAMKRAGAVIVDKVEFPSRDKMEAAEFEVLLYEFKADLDAYLSQVGADLPAHSLRDVIAFNEKNRDREMPHFGQELMTMSEAKGPLTSKPYLEVLATCRKFSRAEGIDVLMRKHALDAIFAPAAGPAWLTDLVTGDHAAGGSSALAAVAGYPNITVPAGFICGLPVGVSFFGAAWSEPRLIEVAYGFEQTTKARQRPRFLESAEVAG
jgi:amidase